MSEKEKFTSEILLKELPTVVQQLDANRSGAGTKSKAPVDLSLEELAKEQYGLSKPDYFQKLGVDTKIHTMANIYSMPDKSIRWLVPEIIREAVVLGMRQAPFYPTIIASDQSVKGLQIVMPSVNMSDAAPARVNEAETIPLGMVSFGEKTVRIFKIGKGFKVTDEVRNYVSLDVMSIFVRDFGVQLGYALDTLAMDALINGNSKNGDESAPVIGVTTPANGITYRDLLRLWVRGSRLGRQYTTLVGDEETAIDLLDLDEFKVRQTGTTQATLNLRSPVPNSADFFIHPGVPDDQLLMVDRRAALIKLTAQQLMMESERIVSNQTSAIYASLTTGFSKMYQDAAVLIDGSLPFATYGFPDFMNPDPFLLVDLG